MIAHVTRVAAAENGLPPDDIQTSLAEFAIDGHEITGAIPMLVNRHGALTGPSAYWSFAPRTGRTGREAAATLPLSIPQTGRG